MTIAGGTDFSGITRRAWSSDKVFLLSPAIIAESADKKDCAKSASFFVLCAVVYDALSDSPRHRFGLNSVVCDTPHFCHVSR